MHEEDGAVYLGRAISVAGSVSSLGTHDDKDYHPDEFVSRPAPATRGGGGGGALSRLARRQGKQQRLPPTATNQSSASHTSLGPQLRPTPGSVPTVAEPLPPCPSAGGAGAAANGGPASASVAGALDNLSVRGASNKKNGGGGGSDGGSAFGFPPAAPERGGFEASAMSPLGSGGGGGSNDTPLSWLAREQEVGGDGSVSTVSLAANSGNNADGCTVDSATTVDSVSNSVTASSFASAGATMSSVARSVTEGRQAARKRGRQRRGGIGSGQKIYLGSKKRQEVHAGVGEGWGGGGRGGAGFCDLSKNCFDFDLTDLGEKEGSNQLIVIGRLAGVSFVQDWFDRPVTGPR